MSKPVLFVSFRPLERAENLRAIYEAYTGSKVHIMQSDPQYRSEVLSGKYDLMVTDDFPSITPGKCIMIWHAIQGGKTIGLDQPSTPYYDRSLADNMTYIISAGTRMTDIWSRCTGVPKERILPLGMPRTDEYFYNNDEPHDKKLYLFVPTFRDIGETPFPDIDWAYIDAQLTDDELLVVKAHPWQAYQRVTDQVTPSFGNGQYKHIVVLSPAGPTAPILYNADVVITDYSSIMFDAYLLGKPVVLFEKTPGYTTTRGMYFRYPDAYCNFNSRNEHMLIEMCRYRSAHPFFTPIELNCRDLVADACDGHSCERICKLIDKLNGGET